MKSYSELITFNSFEDRLNYLLTNNNVGEETFGFDRYLNQMLYKSNDWKRIRNKVIIRDNGCDLGVEGYEIYDRIIIHHINPITQNDIVDRNPMIFDLDNLISVSHQTHNIIHYSKEILIPNSNPIIRTKNDTKLW